MYAYLRRHPAVFMPDEKEPHYFATDLPARRNIRTEGDYLELFRQAGEGCQAVGEASTWYLYSDEALERIREFAPEARILVFFRNPVEFVQSLHDQFAFDAGREPDFPQAWAHGRSRDRLLQAGRFAHQLRKLRRTFPDSQILPALLDDLRTDPRAQYVRTLRFLGLPDDGQATFLPYNARKTHRSTWFARFVRHTPEGVASAWNAVKRAAGIRRIGLLDRLWHWNTRPAERAPIHPGLRDEVRAAFCDEVQELGRLLDRDLSHWR